MKKQKVGLNKLSLTKSRIAELNTTNVIGGNESANTHCIITGPYDPGCVETENCGTNNCGTNNCGTNNCGTNDCGTNNCDTSNCGPTQTRQIISCYEAC